MRCFEYHIMYFVLLFVVLLNCCTVEVRGFGTNTNKHLSQQLQLQFQQRLSGFPELPRFQLKKQLVALVSSFAITTTPFAIPLLSLPTISTADTTRIETVSVSPVRNNGIDSATGTMTRSSTLFSLTKKMFGVEAAVAAEESPSFRSQLRNIQQQQILLQKGQLDAQIQDLLTKVIQYPEGKLIARGVVTLGADNSKGNPFGYSAATDYDPSYDNKDATLFLLAVGREGPPLAARKLPAKDVKFPLVFELTTSDLIFPYTEDAWLKSTNSKDTIALTAIITPANRIAEPNDSERFGFGVSDPITFAGKLSRDSANINVEGKIDKGLFTPQEIAILSAVDTQLERLGTVKK